MDVRISTTTIATITVEFIPFQVLFWIHQTQSTQRHLENAHVHELARLLTKPTGDYYKRPLLWLRRFSVESVYGIIFSQ